LQPISISISGTVIGTTMISAAAAAELGLVVNGGLAAGGEFVYMAMSASSGGSAGGAGGRGQGNVPQNMVPKPGATGAAGATDVPRWARGMPRRVGETPVQYAERLMDAQYGGRANWDVAGARGPTSEFNKIKKYGSRHWQAP
jgi:hypothetical protein